MTSYDSLLESIGSRIDRLPRRCVTALFLACATALRPALDAWALRSGFRHYDLFGKAGAIAEDFATTGILIADGSSLLHGLEAATPAGDSPDEFSPTAAQDCWICLDTAIRAAVDEEFNPGPCIEYALEPKLQAVSERMFGVSEVGSGPGEQEATDRLLMDAEFQRALAFVEWGVGALERVEAPTLADLGMLMTRANSILP